MLHHSETYIEQTYIESKKIEDLLDLIFLIL